MFQINTDFLIVQLKKTFLQKSSCTPPSFHKKERCPSQGFPETSTFYHIFTSFQSEWSVEYFKQNDNIITLETLHPSLIQVKTGAFYRKSYQKHPLFTTFSLFSTVLEMWNFSNKYWLPDKSVKKSFYARGLTLLLISQKIALSMEVSRTIHSLLVFTVG